MITYFLTGEYRRTLSALIVVVPNLTENCFWDDHEGLSPVEHGTERANNLEVICPECQHDFQVCCEY